MVCRDEPWETNSLSQKPNVVIQITSYNITMTS